MPNYLAITGLTQKEFDALFEMGGSVTVAAEFKAKKFAGALKRLELESEDFIQEMICAFLDELPTFNSGKAQISTFAQVVMFKYATKYIRRYGAKSRDPGCLDRSVTGGDTLTGQDRRRHLKFRAG